MTELSYIHNLTKWAYYMINKRPGISIKEMTNLSNDLRILKNENDIFIVVQDLINLKAVTTKGHGWKVIPYQESITP